MAYTYTTTSSGRIPNWLAITGWVIEYWNPETCKLSHLSSLDCSWREAPRQGVTRIWFHIDTGPYIVGLTGRDAYFYHESFRAFGGYQMQNQPHSYEARGSIFCVGDEVVKTRLPEYHRPDFITDEDVKFGIWVPEPYASELGLATGCKTPHITAPFKRYT